MATYTLEELFAVRDKYTEPPYIGFSLAAVCANRNPQKLMRGAGAFKSKPVNSDKERLQRCILTTLNKLSSKNYDTILKDFLAIPCFWTQNALDEFTKQIFQKAENERVFVSIYAKLCSDLVQHEMGLNEYPSNSRNPFLLPQLVDNSKTVFVMNDTKLETASVPQEETEEIKALRLRRRKSAVAFVGHLYLVDVLSVDIIMEILDSLLNLCGDEWEHPTPYQIELAVELLEAVGVTLEQQMGLGPFSDVITRLDYFKSEESVYKPRIKFMMLNLLDRYERGWEPRGSRNQALTSRRATKSVTTPDGLFSPMNRSAGAIRFPEKPLPVEAPKEHPVDSGEIERVRKLVASLWRCWIPGDGKIKNWEAQVMDKTLSRENLASASAVGVVDFACLSSKEAVQRDAVPFLVEGLGCTASELKHGLTRTLRKSFENDAATDAPLYYRRFAFILLQVQAKLRTSPFLLLEILRDAAGFISHLVAYYGMDSEGIMDKLVGIACIALKGANLSAPKLFGDFQSGGLYERKLCIRVVRKLVPGGLLSLGELEEDCALAGIRDNEFDALLREVASKP